MTDITRKLEMTDMTRKLPAEMMERIFPSSVSPDPEDGGAGLQEVEGAGGGPGAVVPALSRCE